MKKTILFFILLTNIGISQNFTCDVGDDLSFETLKIIPNLNNSWTNQNNTFCDTTTRYVFNVNIHVVYKSDGTRVVPIGEAEVLNAIKYLNKGFNQFNIFFKYRETHIILDDENDGYDLNNGGSSVMSWLNSTYGIPNSFNIFVIDPNSTNGYGAGAFIKNTYSMFGSMAFLDEWTLCHEIGHNFGLAHPYNGSNTPYPDLNCENVTRDPDAINYNADSAGDLIIDTHATNQSVWFSDVDCAMTNNPTDCQGTPLLPQSRDNFMFPSDINGNPCTPSFTPKQGERMIGVIIENNYNRFSDASTTLESLFEPFEVKNVPGDVIISVTPIDSENAEVCRNILRQHKFQPGFDYTFTDTFSPDPSSSSIEETPEIKYNTFEFGVKINQISTNCEIRIPVICTRGQICQPEPYVSGKVTSTNDLGSPNFTVIELTEEQLKDPYYIQQLENNKYHVIKKETESGAVYQVTIYKN